MWRHMTCRFTSLPRDDVFAGSKKVSDIDVSLVKRSQNNKSIHC